MSKSRAKKKQRQRARARAAVTVGRRDEPPPPTRGRRGARPADLPPPRPRARAAPAAEPTPRHPSRLEVRDGVARPDAIWAPFPLTEIGMAVGIVLFLIGFAGAPALLLAGVGVLVVVVAELCLREHFAGFRSHSILLALLPVTTVHLAVVLLVSEDWRGPLALAVDLAIAGALAWWLQQRFRHAQSRGARCTARLRARSRSCASGRARPSRRGRCRRRSR